MADLVGATGLDGVSKSQMSQSQMSQLCAEIDERVQGFPTRPLEGHCPEPRLDATHVTVRAAGRIVPVAATMAVGVTSAGRIRQPRLAPPSVPAATGRLAQSDGPAHQGLSPALQRRA